MENCRNQMNLKSINLIFVMILLILNLHFISALIVDADYITVYSGEQGDVKITVKNNLNSDIEDVSVLLNLENTPFTVIGSSEEELDDLDEGDDDGSRFKIKTSADATPGDYQIPYVINYLNSDTDGRENKTGKFGIRVSARTNVDFSVEANNAIIGKQGKVSLKVINKGLGDVKFVSVQIFPQGFELVSPDKVYIGNINSDDFDLATFDIIFKSAFPILSARVEYKDFDNNLQTENLNFPIKVYTVEKATELGLIEKASYTIYIIIAVILVLWLIWRKVKKKQKNKMRR